MLKWKKERFSRALPLLAAAVLTLLCLLAVNDAGLYRQTVVRVTAAETESLGKTTGENGLAEADFRQALTGVICNGSRRGQQVTLSSEYSASQAVTTRYRAGDRLFVDLTGSGGNPTILSVKRDGWLVGLTGLFICTLCCFYRGRGFLILLSLTVNIGLIFSVVRFADPEKFFDRQWLALIAVFCVVTPLLVVGVRRQTLGTILSTLAVTAMMLALYQLTVDRSSVVPYDLLEDTMGTVPIEEIFRFSVIAGSLGAIMDVAVAIHSSMAKLLETGGVRDGRAALSSMRVIGSDIMGTMINILLFSYISQSLQITILKLASGYTLSSIFSYDLIFDCVRFLLGAIGIVATIPVSEGIALLLYRRRRCGA